MSHCIYLYPYDIPINPSVHYIYVIIYWWLISHTVYVLLGAKTSQWWPVEDHPRRTRPVEAEISGDFAGFNDKKMGLRENVSGKPHISWENLWVPLDFPLNQSIDHDKKLRFI